MNKSSNNHVTYSKLQTSDSESEVDECAQKNELTFESQEKLTWKEKFAAFKKLVALIGIPCLIAFSSEFIFFQSIITTIAFPNSPFPPRDHYQYYSITLMTGEVLGRAHRSILEMLKPDWLYKPTVVLLWLLTGLEIAHVVLFFCESWFRFLPEVGLMLFFVFTGGVVVGTVYIMVLEISRASFEGNEREFVLAVSLFPLTFAIFVASLVGLIVEPNLREHCILYLKDAQYCFTRPKNLNSVIKSCKARM